MRKLLILAAIAASLTACTEGDVILPYQEEVAAVKLLGVTDVKLQRPGFTCDPQGETPKVYLGGQTTYMQRGHFFKGKLAGRAITGAVCAGKARPPRVLIMGQPAPVTPAA